jgi:hypothetical protein
VLHYIFHRRVCKAYRFVYTQAESSSKPSSGKYGSFLYKSSEGLSAQQDYNKEREQIIQSTEQSRVFFSVIQFIQYLFIQKYLFSEHGF